MRRLFLMITSIMVVAATSLYANINECKTDIYFGNVVWNTRKAADYNRFKFEELIKKHITQSDPALQAKYLPVKLSYNWGQGYMIDVLETYYQLKESGQISGTQGFFVLLALFKGNLLDATIAATLYELFEPMLTDWEQRNIEEMWQNYYNESFSRSHRVLLVSHSQGDLFANRLVEDAVSPSAYKEYFANLQVATPADHVAASKGDYVTIYIDPIINPIPGSLSPNAQGDAGHQFVEAYLGQEDPLNKTIAKTKTLLGLLDSEVSQWQTKTSRNEGTCDWRITLVHRFDPAIPDIDEEVYPFNPSGKVYSAPDEEGIDHIVKATCGGKEIRDVRGDVDKTCYILEGTGERISRLMERLILKIGLLGSAAWSSGWEYSAYTSWHITTDARECDRKKVYNESYNHSADISLESARRRYQEAVQELQNNQSEIIGCLLEHKKINADPSTASLVLGEPAESSEEINCCYKNGWIYKVKSLAEAGAGE